MSSHLVSTFFMILETYLKRLPKDWEMIHEYLYKVFHHIMKNRHHTYLKCRRCIAKLECHAFDRYHKDKWTWSSPNPQGKLKSCCNWNAHIRNSNTLSMLVDQAYDQWREQVSDIFGWHHLLSGNLYKFSNHSLFSLESTHCHYSIIRNTLH